MMEDPAEIDILANDDLPPCSESKTERVDCTVEIQGVAAGAEAGGF